MQYNSFSSYHLGKKLCSCHEGTENQIKFLRNLNYDFKIIAKIGPYIGGPYNKNPCAWLSWHWSSQGQFALCNPRGWVGSKFNWPSEDQCQRSYSIWVFVFIPHLKSKYSELLVSKLSRKLSICPPWLPWWLIVLVCSLRSARLDIAWLVKSMTYFNLIG